MAIIKVWSYISYYWYNNVMDNPLDNNNIVIGCIWFTIGWIIAIITFLGMI